MVSIGRRGKGKENYGGEWHFKSVYRIHFYKDFYSLEKQNVVVKNHMAKIVRRSFEKNSDMNLNGFLVTADTVIMSGLVKFYQLFADIKTQFHA